MQHLSRSVRYAVGAAVLALVAVGCGSGSEGTAGGSGDGPTLSITSPDDGATVRQPFMLTWDSSAELGPPDTGRDHVHVFVDGNENDYTVVGANEFRIKDLPAGEHDVQISLQHADHSSAGAEDEISVTVSGGGSGESSSSSDDGGGYGY